MVRRSKKPRRWSRRKIWDATPAPVRRCAGLVLKRIPAQYLLGRRFRDAVAMVSDAQWWDAERSRAYQLERLREITRLAHDHAPFYRELFAQAGFDPAALHDVEQLAQLPTIDSDVVRENIDRMCVVQPDAPRVDMVSTGGTSNAPLRFYIDSDRSATEYAYLVSGWARVGYNVNIPMAVFRGRVVPENRRLGFRYAYDPVLRHHYYSSFHMSDRNMGCYLDHLSRQGPLYLHVYPSSAAALARYLRRSGRTAPANVRGIIAESEIVYPDQRRMIEQTFGRRVFASYGLSEKIVAATACEHTDHAHVWPTYGYFELLDDAGNPVTNPGDRGEIVGTGFINRVMPFIRYRTGDRATYVGPRCDRCGRAHPLITDIRGHRTQEMLVAADGSRISWTAINMHDDTFSNVRQFQFYQDTPGVAVLKIVTADSFDERDESRLVSNLIAKLGDRVAFTVEKVDRIALTARAKTVYVDQHILGGGAHAGETAAPPTSDADDTIDRGAEPDITDAEQVRPA